MKLKATLPFLASVAGFTASAAAGNFDLNAHLGSFVGGSSDAIKADVDYDGAGPLPPGVFVIEPRTDGDDWYLPEVLFVEDGAQLVIKPGTTIYMGGDEDLNDGFGAIVVARGGKIFAEGTAREPIVITTIAERDGLPAGHPHEGEMPVAGRDGGLWGGVVLLGRAPLTVKDGSGNFINEKRIEGFANDPSETRNLYGPGALPADPEDSSGVLSYVSVRFGGYEFSEGNEINGLTMGAVGRGTRIENVEVVSNTDDSFEWFGGTVNCRNLVSVYGMDDSFDFDEGFQGTLQNVIAIQSTEGQGADNALETSGLTSNDPGTDPAKATKPVIFNGTFIGNGANNAWRANSRFTGQVHNSVFLNFDTGMRIDDTITENSVAPAGLLKLAGSTWVTPSTAAARNGKASEFAMYDGDFGGTALNREFATNAELKFVGAALPVAGSNAFDPRPAIDSPLWAHNGAIISKVSDVPEMTDDVQRKDLQELPYQGAFGRSNWAAGWTYLSEKGFFADDEVTPAGAPVNISELVAASNPGSASDSVMASVDYGDGPGVLHLSASQTYTLPEVLFVEDGATLVIDPGTTIYMGGDEDLNDGFGAIVVARGGTIVAEGTHRYPIVMTTIAERDGLPAGHPHEGEMPVAGRDGGLWGGVVLLGRAPLTVKDGSGNFINEKRIEGFANDPSETRNLYGPGALPADPEDSSGVLSYVSVRFGGYEFSEGNEINGLTMGAVGRGTRIENVEVVSNTDDSFEWFGGTVNCRNLVSVYGMDDSFDFDEGFQGTLQNVIAIQSTEGQGADNALETSGLTSNDPGTDPAKATKPVIFNGTFIGNGANNAWRANSRFTGQVHNSVFLNFDTGMRIDDTITENSVAPAGLLKLAGSTWVTPSTAAARNGKASEFAMYDGDFGGTALNREFATNAELKFVGAALPVAGSNAFDPRPAIDSPLWGYNAAILTASGEIVEMTNDVQRHNITSAPYQGAFGFANWAEGWTYLTTADFFPGTGGSGQIPAFVDTDGDGLSDFLEDLLVDYGFDKNVAQPTLVSQLLDSQGFYTADTIQDLRGTGIIVQKIGGSVTLELPVWKSDDLADWEPAGTLSETIDGVPADKQFYRLQVDGLE